jgi:uncharacterized membrane protein YhaH (DUF805 family)
MQRGLSVADYYYLDGARNQQGPVPADEIARLIRSGAVRRDTMVWSAGMPDWRPANQVNDLASLFTPAPPPRPAGPPPVSQPPLQRMAPNAGGYQGQMRPAQAAPYNVAKEMGFGGAIKTVFSKYVAFKGRARRPEYWWWILFYVLVLVGLSILDGLITYIGGPGILSTLASLGLFLPTLAVQVRRLHDTDRSGWWVLIGLIPLIGWIIILIFLCQRGTEGPNRFGSDDVAMAAEFD